MSKDSTIYIRDPKLFCCTAFYYSERCYCCKVYARDTITLRLAFRQNRRIIFIEALTMWKLMTLLCVILSSTTNWYWSSKQTPTPLWKHFSVSLLLITSVLTDRLWSTRKVNVQVCECNFCFNYQKHTRSLIEAMSFSELTSILCCVA